MIRLFKVRMADEAPDAVAEVLRSGYIGEGPKVKEFEKQLEQMFVRERSFALKRSEFVLATNSATSAEHLALHILKQQRYLKDGDEVLATPLTCTATNWPIVANGLRIKWVDVDPETLNMDLDDLERKITPSTRAIMAVHWGGYPIDMCRLAEITTNARVRFGFRPNVIQDCAHALGSTFQNGSLIPWADFSTFSFQAIKHLTCGDGGALVTLSERAYRLGKLMRWYGIDREGSRKDFRCELDIRNWGYKFHMNDISATIGLANLSLLDDTIATHKSNGQYYDEALWGIPGVTQLTRHDDRESSYWIYTIRVENRDGFMKMMKEKGVEVSRVHERNDKHTCMNDFRTALPALDVVAKDMICIPVGWWVTKEQREYIVDCIKEGW